MQLEKKRAGRRVIELLDEGTSSCSSPNVAYTGFQSSRQKKQRLSTINVASRLHPTTLLQSQTLDRSKPSQEYLDQGDNSNVCEFCGAMFWFDERVASSPLSQRPKYFICCRHGQVSIDFPVHPPEVIKQLLNDSHFLSNIRAYNSMFSMTSFGAKIDQSVNRGSGPYVFKISGQISHWLGSLCPTTGQRPRFLQMYIFDSEGDISNRLASFGNSSTDSLSPDVIFTLASVLETCNQYVQLFKSAREFCVMAEVPNFCIRLHDCHRQTTYDLPASGSLGAIVFDETSGAQDFDIVIHAKDDTPHRVSKLHLTYMPLQYPLLFPYGEQGWSPSLRLTGNSERCRKLTMNMFYTFQIHDREDHYTHLLHAGRLFQQYLVDCYVSIEHDRLDYLRRNQSDLRSDFLQGVYDALSAGDTEGRHIGKRVILPASFTGGPRYMYQHYQDALAICAVHGNPQYFITFTCNVKWPEIQRFVSRFGASSAQDRPDIIARVFHMKVKSFLNYLKDSTTFGTVTADLYTIEFQKRGLPHCHTLLWVASAHTIREAKDVDRYISAELPNKNTDPDLYRIVTESMLHGPCGLAKPTASCMIENVCSKSFPKPYENISRFDSMGYIHYKRRFTEDHFVKSGIPLDNSYVVPYNEDLCRRFQAHINVEYCGWSMLIKYLFKYISKGADRIKFQVTSSTQTEATTSTEQVVNEIDNFLDGRFICPHEAAWRILNFPIHQRHPSVQILAAHLERKQKLTFKGFEKLSNIVRNPGLPRTTLTQWLANNQHEKLSDIPRENTGLHLTYVQYPSAYTWHASDKIWFRRPSNRAASISRLVYVHPTCGELFYLRLLLTKQVGCCSFEDIRTVDGVTYDSYRLACEKMGLIGDDREWSHTLSEASNWASASELRTLFVHMLLFCEISNPLALWNEHWQKMADDIAYQMTQISTSSSVSTLKSSDVIRDYILYELELLIKFVSDSHSLSEFSLPLPSDSMISALKNRLLLEEKMYDTNALKVEHAKLSSALNSSQLQIYNHVLTNLQNSSQVLLFVYGHGGTGKTFLWKTIISALRSVGKIVLAVAASGIASLLLPSGRTAHSGFKIPLELSEESICYIKKEYPAFTSFDRNRTYSLG